MEGRGLRQDQAQRDRPSPTRAGPAFHHDQHRHRPQPAYHGNAEERGQPSRPDLSAPRKAVRGGQRQRQARELVHRHRHRDKPAGAWRNALRERAVPAVPGRGAEGRGRVPGSAANLRGQRGKRSQAWRERGTAGDRVNVPWRRAYRNPGID